jgi:glycine/D-amino acid oxidase-like deaminating enzyme/nitrite reductase/ring-hydroxylating ferredoxin subunit
MTESYSDRSYWNATCDAVGFPALSNDHEADVVIIGGGIVGITTARLLKDRGLRVAVVEARRVGREVTGRSTAKVTSQHRLIYQTLEQKFGRDHAALYADAQETGVRMIREFAERHSIDCDLERKSAYTFTTDPARVEEFEKEVSVARQVGLPATLVRHLDLPFAIAAAVGFSDQAQFHPTKYVSGLAQTLPGDGCSVFEASRVVDWSPQRVATDGGSITAKHVVMATHMPLGQTGLYYARAYPKAEPVIVARIRTVPADMYLSADQPSHSIRTHRQSDGTVYAIAAGNHFRPGYTDEEREAFADLESWLRQHFGAGDPEYRWVNEDYMSMDSAPFVGWSTGDDSYLVATGFGAWGISNGTAAGLILADLATERDNKWLPLFHAGRVKPVAGAGTFVKENAEVAANLLGGYLARKLKSFDELARGHAAILKIDGKNVAGFRDESGTLHAVSAACTHMGCVLGWNENDRTWDCPCHGSRFALDGAVLHGPAVKPLELR